MEEHLTQIALVVAITIFIPLLIIAIRLTRITASYKKGRFEIVVNTHGKRPERTDVTGSADKIGCPM